MIVCGIFVVAGCDDFSFYGLIDDARDRRDTGLALQISPISATVPAGADLLFSATGGTRPYTYALVRGNGSVDPESGVYTAPATPSVDIVRLIDADGTSVDSQIVVVE